MGGIKGASAYSINKLLQRRGHVWQDESADHVTRSWDDLDETIQYILNNPVRKGLVLNYLEYPWLYHDSLFSQHNLAHEQS